MILQVGTCQKFIISLSGILYVYTKVQMSCKNNVRISIHKASVATGHDLATFLWTKFSLFHKEYSQPSVAVNSKYPPRKCKLLLIKPINTPQTVWKLLFPPALLFATRKVCSSSSDFSSLQLIRPQFFDMTTSSIGTLRVNSLWNFINQPRTVLSLI